MPDASGATYRELTPDRVPFRGVITACAMIATLMQALDATIANVALPYMQGSLSATSDEITWVLTSYIIAAAIMTAPVGWLASRFGRKNLFMLCVAGFTFASMLCGAAELLPQMVLFRLLQGVFGAALVPLSQATILDIYPVERRGSAMALWGIGVMIGPILGPTLGGYLTELYNWRYVFYVNLPFGILCLVGLALCLPTSQVKSHLRFDWTGFAVLALGLGALQMMLDRGQLRDWFSSREIIVEAVLAGLGLYLFVVHLFTARRPFISPAVFQDRNLFASVLMMFTVGTILVASSALMAPYLQNLGNYPVDTTGLVLAPRGIGTMAAMMIAGRLANRLDPRKLMFVGLVLLETSAWMMTGWTPDVSIREQIFAIVVQGAGLGFIFTPLQVVAFATLPVAMRTDGAAMLSLFRNVGAAMGVSLTFTLLARSIQVSHEQLGSFINPFNRALQSGAAARILDPATPHGAALLDQMLNRQAEVIGYINVFKFMMLTTLPAFLLLLIMTRPQRVAVKSDEHAAVME